MPLLGCSVAKCEHMKQEKQRDFAPETAWRSTEGPYGPRIAHMIDFWSYDQRDIFATACFSQGKADTFLKKTCGPNVDSGGDASGRRTTVATIQCGSEDLNLMT